MDFQFIGFGDAEGYLKIIITRALRYHDVNDPFTVYQFTINIDVTEAPRCNIRELLDHKWCTDTCGAVH